MRYFIASTCHQTSLAKLDNRHRVCGFFALVLSAFCLQFTNSLSIKSPSSHHTNSGAASTRTTRSKFLRDVVVGTTAALATSCGIATVPFTVQAKEEDSPTKLRNLSNEELKKIITSDMTERSFLVSADLTREVYDERATFTDEIDSYPMDKWIKGTKKLFVAEGSRVNLVGDVDVTPENVEFRFDEDLMFRIPFCPVVSLSGKVILTRDAQSGLITSYREIWDQDVNSVLKTAKFKASDGSMRSFPAIGGLFR